MPLLPRLLAATLLSVGLALPALPALADAAQRLKDYAQRSKTLRGEFSQQVYDRKGRLTQESSGELFFSRPGKFRWAYNKPYEQLIVGDGSRIWIHDADLQQVTVKKLDKALGESPAALLAGSNDIDKHFNLRETGIKDGLDWLEATPKSKEGTFEMVRLGFKGGDLQAMDLLDNFGQTTRLRFSDLRPNAKLGAELFRFTPPKGTDVIGDD